MKWEKFPDIFSKFPDFSLTWRKFCFSLTFPWHVATLIIVNPKRLNLPNFIHEQIFHYEKRSILCTNNLFDSLTITRCCLCIGIYIDLYLGFTCDNTTYKKIPEPLKFPMADCLSLRYKKLVQVPWKPTMAILDSYWHIQPSQIGVRIFHIELLPTWMYPRCLSFYIR